MRKPEWRQCPVYGGFAALVLLVQTTYLYRTRVAYNKSSEDSAPAARLLPESADPSPGQDIDQWVKTRPVKKKPKLGPLARVYVVNVESAKSRWQHMEHSLGHIFNGKNGLPKWARFNAATPWRDGCDLPYSLSDCCTESHMNVMRNFSQDPNVRDDQWVLVLEDDVMLHPSVPPFRLEEIITTGLNHANTILSPFVYMGLCGPTCRGPQQNLPTTSGVEATFQSHCGGFCTHAYAVQKFMAPHIPNYIAASMGKSRTIDQALSRLAMPLNMSLLGSSLRSPDVRARGSVHAGLFYMVAFSDSLTTGEWDQKPKVVFRLGEWSGRIGNLMFEWAAVTALAKKAGAETHAYYDVTHFRERAEVPAVTFFRKFRLQRFSRDAADVRELKPKCTVTFEEAGANTYRVADVDHLMKQIRDIENAKPSKCKLLEVTIKGYLQSWKYFQGFESTIRHAYEAPPAHLGLGLNWLDQVRTRLAERSPEITLWKFVGVQVRRGDKMQGVFKSVYEPVDWPYYQKGMLMLKEKLENRQQGIGVVFVVTAGGTLNKQNSDNNADVSEAHALESVSEYVLFTEDSDPYSDFALLTLMDGMVISSGSFGWWSAFMSKAGSAEQMVVCPRYLYKATHPLAKNFKAEDYYPPSWIVLDNTMLTASG